MSTETAAPSRTASLALWAAVASGSLVALQQRVNGELKTALGDALLTALVSFGTGLVAVVVVVLSRSSARSAVGRVRNVPWVQRLGGLGGAALVVVGAAAAAALIASLGTAGLMAGVLGDNGTTTSSSTSICTPATSCSARPTGPRWWTGATPPSARSTSRRR